VSHTDKLWEGGVVHSFVRSQITALLQIVEPS